MTSDERRNEVLKLHANFMNSLAIAAAGGAGFTAIDNGNWIAAIIFMLFSAVLHLSAAEVLDGLRVTS